MKYTVRQVGTDKVVVVNTFGYQVSEAVSFAQGKELARLFTQLPESHQPEYVTCDEFKQVVNALIDLHFSFEVGNAMMLTEDSAILKYLPDGCVGTDFMYLNVIIGNHDYVVYHYDWETLTELVEELANWS